MLVENLVDYNVIASLCNSYTDTKYKTQYAIFSNELAYEEEQTLIYPRPRFLFFKKWFEQKIQPEIEKSGINIFLKNNKVNKINYAVSYLVNNVKKDNLNKNFGYKVKLGFDNQCNIYRERYNCTNFEEHKFFITKNAYKKVLDICDALNISKECLYFLAIEFLMIDVNLKNKTVYNSTRIHKIKRVTITQKWQKKFIT